MRVLNFGVSMISIAGPQFVFAQSPYSINGLAVRTVHPMQLLEHLSMETAQDTPLNLGVVNICVVGVAMVPDGNPKKLERLEPMVLVSMFSISPP